MNEKKILNRNVRRENELQYGPQVEQWPLNADLRRHFYLEYAIHPDHRAEGKQPRDIWREGASIFAKKVSGPMRDYGTGSGYFIHSLLEQGYDGPITGVDIAASHFPVLDEALQRVSNGNIIELIQGDAADASAVEPDSLRGASALYVCHHMPLPERLFKTIHKAVENGGLAGFGGREVDNLANAWTMAEIVAEAHNAVMPEENFYSHFPLSHIRQILQDSPDYEIEDELIQDETIFTPISQEGWLDERNVITSYLPLMRSRTNGRQLSYGQVKDFLEGVIRPDYFESLGRQYGGNFPDHLSQGIIFARVKK